MRLGGKLLIGILVILIIIQFVALFLLIVPYREQAKSMYVLYTKPGPVVESEAQRREILDTLFDTWFGFANQLSEQEKKDYYFHLFNDKTRYSITKNPRWDRQYTHQENLPDILRQLDENPDFDRFSYQLPNGYWYNYRTVELRPIMPLYISLALIVEAIILGIIIFYYWSTLRFTTPLTDFKRFSKQIGRDLNAKVPATLKKGPRAIREIASAVDEMQVRLQDLINTRTDMLTTIAHDLRTPITRLKIRAQLIEDKEIEHKLTQDLNEMEAMISSVLYFARTDVIKEKKKRFDLSALVASCCDEFADLGHHIIYETDLRELVIYGTVSSMKRVINNIVSNAVKHAKRVEVTLTHANKEAVIKIRDNGPGIPEDELEEVFKPFYRGTTKRYVGAGLGLAIAREIIQSNGGTIELKNIKPHGLEVTITIPELPLSFETHEVQSE
jgi:signal transduction histidine kinase